MSYTHMHSFGDLRRAFMGGYSLKCYSAGFGQELGKPAISVLSSLDQDCRGGEQDGIVDEALTCSMAWLVNGDTQDPAQGAKTGRIILESLLVEVAG